MGCWDDLSSDLLLQIAERIPRHTDLLSFGAVCKLSHSSLKQNLHRLPHKLPLSRCLPYQPTIPLLMRCYHDEKHDGMLEFFSVPDKRTYSGFLVPEIANKWITESSNGWLVTTEIYGQQVHLLNPLTRAQLRLPSLSTFKHPIDRSQPAEYDDFRFIYNASISEEPYRRGRERDWIVMAIVSEFEVLSYCKRGDEKWTNIKGSPVYVSDVIPYEGQFYALCEWGLLVACDIADGMKVTIIAGISDDDTSRRYLVESSSGDLLQVVRVVDSEVHSKTVGFMVFKLVVLGGSNTDKIRESNVAYYAIEGNLVEQQVRFEWIKLEDLGDQILFVGCNRVVSCPSQTYKCKGNCIYFADDTFVHLDVACGTIADKLPYHMGIFDMEGKHKTLGRNERKHARYCTPTLGCSKHMVVKLKFRGKCSQVQKHSVIVCSPNTFII